MKNKILLFLLSILIFSCTQQQQQSVDIVRIKGEVLSGKAKDVKFQWIVDNPITGKGKEFNAEIDENSNFSIEISLKHIATGRIAIGRYFHEICLIPGDDLFISVNGDTIKYTGKGAAKNNYLYQAELNNISDGSYYSLARSGKLTPVDFSESLKKIKQKRMNFIDDYSDSVKLQKEFIDFYKIETNVIYENQLQGYVRRYAYKNKIPKDSLKLPKEYNEVNSLVNLVDDSKIVSSGYISNLRNKIFDKAREIIKVDTTKKWDEAKYIALFDSLSGKTKEYVLTKWIIDEFSRDTYDTIAISEFNELEKDDLAISEFNHALEKYNEKRSLIGQPLHTEFAETMLKDTSETDITFAEMLNRYKGKVVYLDIWSLRCGPCIAAMPHSKKLKEKLGDLPIEFVYIAQDKPNKKLWENIFKKTFTNKNQYRMVKHQWGSSRMLKFMEISWVPCFMIFDKDGQLYDYNAPRPYVNKRIEESELEKTLKMLASK